MDEIRRLHADVTARFPQLDTLVNNAGIMRNLQLAEERSLEDVTREIEIDRIAFGCTEVLTNPAKSSASRRSRGADLNRRPAIVLCAYVTAVGRQKRAPAAVNLQAHARVAKSVKGGYGCGYTEGACPESTPTAAECLGETRDRTPTNRPVFYLKVEGR